MQRSIHSVARVLIALLVAIAVAPASALAATPPPNDNFAAAIDVTVPTVVSGTTDSASLEASEPQCSSSMNRTVWYRIQPQRTGILQVLPSYGVSANVWSGTSLGSLGYVSCFAGTTSYRLNAGATYYVQIGQSPQAVNPVSFSLNMTFDPAPANDDFAAAADLAVPSSISAPDTYGATHEPNEPLFCSAYGSVWYHVLAPTTGILTITHPPLPFGPYTTVLVYRGDSLGALVVTQSSNPGCTNSPTEVAVSAGETVWLQVTSPLAYTLGISIQPPPANDAFALASEISVPSVQYGNAQGTSVESGEPRPSCAPSDLQRRSRWYRFTTPAYATLFIGAGSLEFRASTVVALYRGSRLGSLSEAACVTAASGLGTQLEVDPEMTFYLQVVNTGGDYVFTVGSQPAPTNDPFAIYQVVSVPGSDVQGTTVAATHEPFEPQPSCAPGRMYSVWYRFTASSSGTARVFLPLATRLDAVMAMYRGDALDALTELDCVVRTAPATELDADVDAGQTYVIQVSTAGDFTMSFGFDVTPDNDTLAGARTLTLPSATTESLGTLAARVEAGEPLACGPLQKSVWYRFVAKKSGPVTAMITSGGLDARLALYRGTALSSLTAVACGTSFRSASSSLAEQRLTATVVSGATYYLRVGSTSRRGGPFDLEVATILPPSNDEISAAPKVKVTTAVGGSNLMAASEPVPATCGDLRRAVWYSVTAPARGTLGVTVTATSGGYQPVVAIYSSQAGVLTELGCADSYKGQIDVARALAAVSVGQTYLIRIGGEAGQTGMFKLELGMLQ